MRGLLLFRRVIDGLFRWVSFTVLKVFKFEGMKFTTQSIPLKTHDKIGQIAVAIEVELFTEPVAADFDTTG